MEKHLVASIVFVEVEGVDQKDAAAVGEDAVAFSLHRQINEHRELSFRDTRGRTHTATLHSVMGLGRATRGGYLELQTTSQGYRPPRDDEPEEGQ